MGVFAIFVWGVCVGSEGNFAVGYLFPPLHVSRLLRQEPLPTDHLSGSKIIFKTAFIEV